MKIIKTGKYKKISQQSDNRDLASRLLDWHGGQSSPLYALGSSWLAGKAVPDELVDRAIEELEDIAQRKVNYPQEVSEKDVQEVKLLQQELKNTLGKNSSLYNTNDPNRYMERDL